MRGGVVERRAEQHDLGTEIAGAANLQEWRRLRHHDDRPQAEARAVIRDALAVISGGHRDDAAAALHLIEDEHRVERTAFFVRAGRLTRLEFEEDLRAGRLGENPRARGRRAHDPRADALGGGPDVGGGNLDRRHGSQAAVWGPLSASAGSGAASPSVKRN